jgi:hypothetical protein
MSPLKVSAIFRIAFGNQTISPDKPEKDNPQAHSGDSRLCVPASRQVCLYRYNLAKDQCCFTKAANDLIKPLPDCFVNIKQSFFCDIALETEV